MNITNTKPDAFANGFDYFCVNCGRFFSAQIMDDNGDIAVSFCPHCGESDLIDSIEGLLTHCDDHFTDPVNFYHAFPSGEPIPHSRTGATPKQVEWIIGCVISDKQKKLPVTIESLAAQLGYDKEMVGRVFDELHITETGGAT